MTPSKPTTPDAGKKIILNFGGRSSKAVLDMAAATLEAGGYSEPPHCQRDIGETMPDGTVYAGVSPDTGNAMYTTPTDAPVTMKFNEAQKYAKKLDAHGHKDWRVPTKNELKVLFNNRAAIGGFDVTGSDPAGWYWSSSPGSKWRAWSQRFSVGDQGDSNKLTRSSVRCVRSPRPALSLVR